MAWTEDIVHDAIRRAQANGTFDTVMTLQSALRRFYDVGRANQIESGIRIAWSVEKPATERRVFGNRNIVTDTQSLRYIPVVDRADVIEVKYRDASQDYAERSKAVPSSTYRTLTRPARTTTLDLRLCSSEEQAIREGRLRMNLNEMLKRSISFRAGLETINFTPGNLVRFEHDGSRTTFSGAVRSVSGAIIYLDQTITLDTATFAGNCRIWISTATDQLLQADILGPFDTETDHVTVSTALAGVNADGPPNFDPYMIGRHVLDVHLYRVLDISRPNLDPDSKKLESSIEAIEYVEATYYHAGGAIPI